MKYDAAYVQVGDSCSLCFLSGVLHGMVEFRDNFQVIIYIILRKQTLETGFWDWVAYLVKKHRDHVLSRGEGEWGMDNSWRRAAARLLKWSRHDSEKPGGAPEGQARGDQVAVGLDCYSDSHVCKDRGDTWLLLRTLDSPREMKSFKDILKNAHREPEGLQDSLEGILPSL